MEKLRSKTFYTIFSIISSFIFLAVLFFNIQSYQKEFNGIKNNLRRMSDIIRNPVPDKKIENNRETMNNELNKRIIMDYNFYTLILDENNNILDMISHNENQLSNNIISEALDILSTSKKSEIKINCLYFDNFSYEVKSGNYLTIVDNSNVQERLLTILFMSIIILILFESLIYYFSRKITNWIIKPVEDSFKKQKEFIADASHELKTPLAVIMANIDSLEIDEKNEKWINNLKSESERMNHLITRLLELSRSEKKCNDNHTLNNLSKIVAKRALIFESLAFENKVEIETNIEENIMFKCNSNDIDELIGIIIDNAIKHSFNNTKIKVNLYKEKNNIIIDIINKGKEIPKEECEKIFERFYRSDKSRNRAANRYGLGLAIAKNIVKNYNGEIKAFSENEHTTFRIKLINYYRQI